ncbi:MAG: hypothetical protein CME15_14655 [Gemmatimonadetes bacterium]|jgi:protein involved in polysaccharide export with SLBB domain|nr:hypothetical protein [Gemmatimonadota bacterium]
MERSRLFALLAALLALPWQAGGQQTTEDTEDTQGPPIGLAAFREVIASGRYLVGPGDQFLIYVTGMALPAKSRVMAEGGLFIPGVGLVPVGGLRLRDAHAAIDSAFRQAVTIGDIDVELSKPRSIPVPVLGLVSKPGILIGTGVDRVSAILQRAGGTLGSNRDIRLIRTTSQSPDELARLSADLETGDYSSLKGFESVRIDLDMYSATGRLGLNPFIEDGDIIFVPGKRGQITAVAAVMRPGAFEFVEGDRLSDLLELALGPAPNHDPDNVLLFRYGDDLTQMYTMPLDIAGILRRDPVADLPLRDGDWLVLRRIPRYHEPSTVTVLGEFVYPGEYVVDVDGTPLSKVIEGAGGLTKDASLQRARVIRREEEDEDKNFLRIESVPVADRTDDEDQYFIMKSVERSGRLVVDFTALYQGDVTQDIQLLPGDAILVPRLQQIVKVSGSADPGAVVYHPEYGVEDYIAGAGGPGWRASDEIRVIKARTGEMERAADIERIDPGDRVWIKEKPRRDHWSIFTQVTTVIGQAATLVLLYVSLTN